MNTFAIDVGLGLGPTPIIMLITVALLVAVLAGIFLLASQALGSLVDKRWPADEALTPSELLWGEVGGHVGKTFPGLDPEIARDLSPFVSERKVARGDTIVEAGLPAVAYYVVVKGEVSVQSNPPETIGKGGHFGGDDILRRRANSHSIVATDDATLVWLPADDYIAGLALGAEVGDDEYVDHALEKIVAAGRIPEAVGAQPMSMGAPAPAPAAEQAPPPAQAAAPQPVAEQAPPAPAAQPAPAPAPTPEPAAPTPVSPVTAASSWSDATHTVGAAGLPGYPLPEGETATVTLPAGSPILWVEGLPGWAHVRTEGGWQGWVRTDGIAPRSIEIEFHIGHPDEVVAEMERLADGSGWITLLPGVMSEDVPPPSGGLFNIFSAGSDFHVPEGSWLPPSRPNKPIQIGVRHNHGPKAKDHLTARGNPIPIGWRKAMDHPKRGLVVEVPADTDHREVIDWLLSSTILLTRVPLLEDWLARIHEG